MSLKEYLLSVKNKLCQTKNEDPKEQTMDDIDGEEKYFQVCDKLKKGKGTVFS